MKFEFDVLYGNSSSEVKRQLNEAVRDDAELLGEIWGASQVDEYFGARMIDRHERPRHTRTRYPGLAVDVKPGKSAEQRDADKVARQRTLIALKLCINGASHGLATHGRRCEWCALVNNHGLQYALRQAELGLATKPAGYIPRPRGSGAA